MNVLLALLLSLTSPARAHCGSASCPIDSSVHERPAEARLSLDLSFQYIDQHQSWAGRHPATVGQVPNPEHDELRTINRLYFGRLDYDAAGWGVGVSAPFVSRTHDHLMNDMDGMPEHWSFSGLGDLTVTGRVLPLPWLVASLGVKAPTGRTNARSAGGETAEITSQPGTGSWDLFYGLTAMAGPLFAGAQYKQNRPGSAGYRVGDELMLHAGGAQALLGPLDGLLQANLRVKRRDYNGQTLEDTSFTGSEALYLSPGLRWRAADAVSLYGYVQLPVYQRVDKEQLTAKEHWLMGVTYSFAASAL